jgi:sulfonate transport system permease protein
MSTPVSDLREVDDAATIAQPDDAPASSGGAAVGFETATSSRLRVPRSARRMIGPLLLVGFWWLASVTGVLDERTLASPVTVVSSAWDMLQEGILQEAIWVSLQRVLQGVFYGVVAGVTLAVLSGLFRWGEDLIDVNVQLLRTIPIIGLLPLFIIWFGIDETPKIVMVAVAVMFPIYINTFAGIRGVDERLVEAGTTFGLNRWGLIRHVLLPGALPGFLIGLRFALVVSWLVLVFSETINAQRGLGFLLNNARTFYQTDRIVVVLAVYGIIGIACDAIVRLLERRFLGWRRGFQGQ